MKIQKTYKALSAVALLAAMIVLAADSSALAENPANWNFSAETHGSDVQWDSPTQVDTGFPAYTVDFETTLLDIELANVQWFGLDASSLQGAAILPGPLPLVIVSDSVASGDSSIDITLWIDAAGQGHLGLTNAQFGTFNGLPITGFRMGGTFNAEGVPEPTSLVLLGLGSLATLLTRRRRDYI